MKISSINLREAVVFATICISALLVGHIIAAQALSQNFVQTHVLGWSDDEHAFFINDANATDSTEPRSTATDTPLAINTLFANTPSVGDGVCGCPFCCKS